MKLCVLVGVVFGQVDLLVYFSNERNLSVSGELYKQMIDDMWLQLVEIDKDECSFQLDTGTIHTKRQNIELLFCGFPDRLISLNVDLSGHIDDANLEH